MYVCSGTQQIHTYRIRYPCRGSRCNTHPSQRITPDGKRPRIYRPLQNKVCILQGMSVVFGERNESLIQTDSRIFSDNRRPRQQYNTTNTSQTVLLYQKFPLILHVFSFTYEDFAHRCYVSFSLTFHGRS